MSDPVRTVRPLRHEGAVPGEGPDAAVPAHYGAPLREQRHLLDGTAVVDLGHLELLEVRGADARSWMTTVSTQVLTGTPVGTSSSLAVLSPRGRVEHLASAVVLDEDALLLITDPGARAGLRGYLEMMRFAARVELTDRDDLRVLGGLSPAAAALPDLDLPTPVAVWDEPWPEVAPGGVAYGPAPEDPVRPVLTVLEAAPLAQRPWRAAHLAGMSSWEALRIANHRARFVCEVDERSIPHELDLLRTAVHTEKGCYRGQETVAKVLNLGQPPRRLVMLHLDGSQDMPVPAGGEVRLDGPDGKVIGAVTSAALHADLGPIALAVVRRAVPLDAALSVQVPVGEGEDAGSLWIDAAQEPIVLPREHGERPATAKL
ncbi:YgfZ/GcvT domain-containing protein [Brachybacterium saurashtrense]|uniref:Folate-binding protein n=1 Tax=Brachybacterium saurashtrense TaxID=556288 RepID=A0A345YQ17_9MICO|nr:folate-binding protein YgfZ [Brachybacterium saurashtrense]AXK46019.1 folate-binding protein [Brachybacterium saurashtrense]RRR23758.1 folate-binding protein [Brachybacterium saurashtrense]